MGCGRFELNLNCWTAFDCVLNGLCLRADLLQSADTANSGVFVCVCRTLYTDLNTND